MFSVLNTAATDFTTVMNLNPLAMKIIILLSCNKFLVSRFEEESTE
jgi:hypothetical protein